MITRKHLPVLLAASVLPTLAWLALVLAGARVADVIWLAFIGLTLKVTYLVAVYRVERAR